MKASDVYASPYVCATDLKDGPVEVVVIEIAVGNFGNEGAPKKDKITLRFDGCKKGMVVNKTNMLELVNALGDNTDDWLGARLTLGVRKVMFQNRLVDGVAIIKAVKAYTTPTTAGSEVNNGKTDKRQDDAGANGTAAHAPQAGRF